MSGSVVPFYTLKVAGHWSLCLLCYMKDVLHCSIFFKWNKLVRVRVRVRSIILRSSFAIFSILRLYVRCHAYAGLPHHYPFVRGIHLSTMDSPRKWLWCKMEHAVGETAYFPSFETQWRSCRLKKNIKLKLLSMKYHFGVATLYILCLRLR